MLCPSCGQGKARRACPGLAQTICPVCCGTKRQTEIACPPDCGYLSTARQHPAAVVQRQQARDVAVLLPTLRQLSERQHQLFFLFQTVIARHKPEGFARLADADVVEAADALASSLETASRGVIYDHEPSAPIAQALANDMKTLLTQARDQGATIGDLEAAAVLRAIEQGARLVGKSEGGDSAYLQLLARLLHVNRAQETQSESGAAPSSLILP